MPIFDVIGEFIGQMIIEPILHFALAIPGAFFRFLISRLWLSKRTLKDYLKDDPFMNGVVGLVVLIIIGVSIANA